MTPEAMSAFQDDLAQITAIVDTAERLLAEHREVDVSPLEQRVGDLCARAMVLREHRPDLLDENPQLLEGMTKLEAALERLEQALRDAAQLPPDGGPS